MPPELRARKHLPTSKSAIKQAYKKKLQAQGRRALGREERIERLQMVDPSAPSATIKKIADKLPRTQASLLIQLITEHVPLYRYLHRFKKADSSTCPACHQADESVHHFLIVCQAYDVPRREMRRELRGKAGKLDSLLTDERCTKALFKFITATQRFRTTHGNLELPDDDED